MLLEGLDDGDGDGDLFPDELANALKNINEWGWDYPFASHGNSGHDFSFRINKEFLIVFRRNTDRTAKKTPLMVHFYLKTIERLK